MLLRPAWKETSSQSACQNVRDHRKLSGTLLVRCLYHAVQADDRKFKEELGRVIEMDIWDAAKAVTTERLKGARQQLSGQEAESRVRQELLATLQGQVSHSILSCSTRFQSADSCSFGA